MELSYYVVDDLAIHVKEKMGGEKESVVETSYVVAITTGTLHNQSKLVMSTAQKFFRLALRIK